MITGFEFTSKGKDHEQEYEWVCVASVEQVRALVEALAVGVWKMPRSADKDALPPVPA